MSESLPPHVEVRIDRSETCWLWTGPLRPSGYAYTTVKRRTLSAHRYVYRMLAGPIPEGMHLDHLCRVRHCVRPDHLEPVTQAENNRRMEAAKTHCPNGHPYEADNLITWPSVTSRGRLRCCAECRRASQRVYMRKFRAQRKAAA